METLETIVLIAAISALIAGLHWLDRRFDLGLDMGMSTSMDGDWDPNARRSAAAQAEIERLRKRIEELEAVVAEPEFNLAREFAKL